MSIDVEGGELDVLYGIDLNKYKVNLLVVENLLNEPKIEQYMSKFNYVLDQRIDYNEYYVLKK